MNGEERQEMARQVHTELVPLRDYFEAILREKEMALSAALTSAEKAVTAALAAADKATTTAFEAQQLVNQKQNEFRQMALDQQGRYLPSETFSNAMADMTRRMESIESERTLRSQRVITYAITAIGAMAAIGIVIIQFLHR